MDGNGSYHAELRDRTFVTNRATRSECCQKLENRETQLRIIGRLINFRIRAARKGKVLKGPLSSTTLKFLECIYKAEAQ